jgi:hypothetical protein
MVRDPGRVGAERRLDVAFPVLDVGERQDGVGVGVIDVRVRYERVQERLDRRAARPGLHLAVAQPRHHRVVVHRLV